jgi:DegV family protein with EDD domain
MNPARQVISSIDAADMAAALRSGIHCVIAEQELLNRINVFPVPDGDTGTNLTLSLSASLGILRHWHQPSVGALLERVADALLDGARGNSGAIVAQFFQGMSDSAEGVERFTPETFAAAVTKGAEYAHDALEQPREGTILTVTAAVGRSMSQALYATGTDCIGRQLGDAIKVAEEALAATQGQLEALRKAGVVDAGAKGFVVLLEGFSAYLRDGIFCEEPELALHEEGISIPDVVGEEADLTYRFCTECIVSGDNIDRRKLREALSGLGDSLVLAGSRNKAKIHIHVNEPEAVFAVAKRFGALHGEKADDMERQQHSTHGDKKKFAVITDSAADIPEDEMERLDIHMVPARIHFGDHAYLDKVTITPEQFFEELRTNPVSPKSSQPSPGDFRRQYQFLASHYPDVISINLTPTVSGTLQTARHAAGRVNAAGEVHVVNSLNASLGEGLITIYAAECAEAGLSVDDTLKILEPVVRNTYTFGLVKDLQYAVRGGRVPASRKMLADLLRVVPILQTDPEGRLSANGFIIGRFNLLERFARFVAKRIPGASRLRVAIGHALCEDQALALESMLRKALPQTEKTYVTDLGTAIGVHGGPGTIVVAVQHYSPPDELLASLDSGA